MEPSDDIITDVWFRTSQPLDELAKALGLINPVFDSEDYWAWAIGTLDGVELDITRTHTGRRLSVDTRIFRTDGKPISLDQRAHLVDRLRPIARGSISWGRWVHLRGNDYDLQIAGQVAAVE